MVKINKETDGYGNEGINKRELGDAETMEIGDRIALRADDYG